VLCFFFFFQAEDGIRDRTVTGVQTCALPICPGDSNPRSGGGEAERSARAPRSLEPGRRGETGMVPAAQEPADHAEGDRGGGLGKIGRASCRERLKVAVGEGAVKEIKGEVEIW